MSFFTTLSDTDPLYTMTMPPPVLSSRAECSYRYPSGHNSFRSAKCLMICYTIVFDKYFNSTF